MGTVTAGVEQIPLLLDFQKQAARYRLKTTSALRQEITLDILSKPLHRKASAFFHRLKFLEAGFGQMVSGPDYRTRDTSRVREKWKYSSSAKVQAALVGISYLGGTVREAASTLLARKQRSEAGCGAFTRLLIDAAVMGLTGHIKILLYRAGEAVAQDGSFLSLCQAAGNLLFLENAKWLLNLPEDALQPELLRQVYQKSLSLLPALAASEEAEDRELAKSLKELYQISRRDGIDAEPLAEALADLIGRGDPPPCVQGSAIGLLYADSRMDAAEALGCARGYLFGTGEQMKKAGLFLGGLFLTAWDILFADSGFLELLPDLRLAFSTFTPTQIGRIGDAVSALLGVKPQDVAAAAVPEQVLALGLLLDSYARETLAKQEVAEA